MSIIRVACLQARLLSAARLFSAARVTGKDVLLLHALEFRGFQNDKTNGK